MFRKLALFLASLFFLFTAALAQPCPPQFDTVYCGSVGQTPAQFKGTKSAQCTSNAYNTNTCQETTLLVVGGKLTCSINLTSQSVYGGPPTVTDFQTPVVCNTGYAPDNALQTCKSTANCTPVACPTTQTRELDYYLCNVKATLSGNVGAGDCDKPTPMKAQGSAVCMNGCWATATSATGHFKNITGRTDWKEAWLLTSGPLTGAECNEAAPVPWAPPAGPPAADPPLEPEYGTPVDPGMPTVPGFYTPKYPGGLGPLLQTKLQALKTSNIGSLLSWMVPSAMPAQNNPTWQLNIAGNTYTIAIGANVWNFLRVVMLISALLVARKLIFGG